MLLLFAARPSHGKSMFLKLLARSVMRDVMARETPAGAPRDAVVYVTPEEPSEKLFRKLADTLPHSYRDIHWGNVPADFNRL